MCTFYLGIPCMKPLGHFEDVIIPTQCPEGMHISFPSPSEFPGRSYSLRGTHRHTYFLATQNSLKWKQAKEAIDEEHAESNAQCLHLCKDVSTDIRRSRTAGQVT